MHFLIVYGTTEGHTRDVCHFVARCLRETGHTATVEEAGLDPRYPRPEDYDAVLLAASLHVGRYQPQLVRFAQEHHESLNRLPTAFISVSLSAAGVSPEDWEGLRECLGRFNEETHWTPGAVHQAGGAILNSQYDFFKRLVLQHIARQRGQKTSRSHDYDLTDYEGLKTFVLGFAVTAQKAKSTGG